MTQNHQIYEGKNNKNSWTIFAYNQFYDYRHWIENNSDPMSILLNGSCWDGTEMQPPYRF